MSAEKEDRFTKVVFYRSKGLIARIICAVTKDERPTKDDGVSHVAIVVDDTYPREVAHSTSGGVRRDVESVWIKRHHATTVETWAVPYFGDGLEMVLSKRQGEGYDYWALIGHLWVAFFRRIFGKVAKNPTAGVHTVCSEFVVRCARESDTHFGWALTLPAESTTPETLRAEFRRAAVSDERYQLIQYNSGK